MQPEIAYSLCEETQIIMSTPIKVLCASALFVLIVTAAIAQPSHASGLWYVATTGSDSNDCATPATPCASINGALNKPGFVAGDTIRVAAGTYIGTGSEVVLLNKSVYLSGGWNEAFSAQIGTSTIDGQAARRGVFVAGAQVTIEMLTIQNGLGTDLSASGGGLRNDSGQVLILNSQVLNSMAAYGGGISNLSGTLRLVNSRVSGNLASTMGGGIRNWGGSTVLITNSLISNNTVGFPGTGIGGSAISNAGYVELDLSTVSDNVSLPGMTGGAVEGGSALINNSTISDNQGGPGIYLLGGTVTLNNDTIVGNQEFGVYNIYGTVNLQNSILANNGTWDCIKASGYAGATNSLGYNLIQKSVSCVLAASDIVAVDPGLDVLQDNGGPTPTRALLPGSHAIDAGNPTGCSGSTGWLETDQRGAARYGRCDIGAYELQPLDFSTKSAEPGVSFPGDLITYTIVLTNGSDEVLDSVLMTDTLPLSTTTITDSVIASSGSYTYSQGTITWLGAIAANTTVTITYQAVSDLATPVSTTLLNVAEIETRGLKTIRSAGVQIHSRIAASRKRVSFAEAAPGKPLIYSIDIANAHPNFAAQVFVTDSLPSELAYVPQSLTATSGEYGYHTGVITWSGWVGAGQSVAVYFQTTLGPSAQPGTFITNTVALSNGGEFITRTAVTQVGGYVCNFQKQVASPVLSVGTTGSWDQSLVYDPAVLKNGDRYEMWYSGSNGTANRIGYATSADGLTWAKYGSNPVLSPSLAWESNRVFGPTVILDTGVYKMWYAASDGTTTRLGYATSLDGVIWTKQSSPVLDVGAADTWDSTYVSRPSVVKIGSTYHLWYTGNNGSADRIGHATSTNGINWTKDVSNPIIDLGAPGAWDWLDVYAPSVVPYGDKYLMWYSGSTLPAAYQTGLAISTDGTTWSKQADRLTQGAAGTLDSNSADYPAVVFDGTQFKIWYSGLNSAGTYSIGYATAQLCGTGPTPLGARRVYLPIISKQVPPAPACSAYYTDNFSNSNSGWYVSDNTSRRYAYINGEYQIWAKNPNEAWFGTAGAKATDFTASVSLRRTSGTSGAYGLLFGINEDWSQFIEVLIDAEWFSVWRYNQGWEMLQDWTASPAIASSTNWNRLKVVRDGAQVHIYINSQLVSNVTDFAVLGLRRIGLVAQSDATGVDIRFDDFAMYPMECGSQVYRATVGDTPFEMGKPEARAGLIPPRPARP